VARKFRHSPHIGQLEVVVNRRESRDKFNRLDVIIIIIIIAFI